MIPWDESSTGRAAQPRTIWVSRHARTAANESGLLQGWGSYELSAQGSADAVAAAAWWRRIPIDWVVTSPVARALQTAEVIFGRVDDIDSGWGEQATPDLAGVPGVEAHAMYPDLIGSDGWSLAEAPLHRAVEHIETVTHRALASLRRLATSQGGGDVAVVTHGAVVLALARAAGLVDLPIPNLVAVEIGVDGSVGWEIRSVREPLTEIAGWDN